MAEKTSTPSAVAGIITVQPTALAFVTPLHELDGDVGQWIVCPFCQQVTRTTVTKSNRPDKIGVELLCFVVSSVCVCCTQPRDELLMNTTYRCGGCQQKVVYMTWDGFTEIYGPGPNGSAVVKPLQPAMPEGPLIREPEPEPAPDPAAKG